MLMMVLVGCNEEKLDLSALDYDWVFVEMESLGEIVPHTPGLESKEPTVMFEDSNVFFSLNGNGRNGKVTANKDNYSITFDDGSRPMVAKLSDDGNTLTLSIEDLNMHFRFTKN